MGEEKISLFDLLPDDSDMRYNEKTMIYPTTAIMSITNRCNLACPYCFHKQSNYDMNFETADKAARFLLANSVIAKRSPSISFFGGEPLLNFDKVIVPLVRKYGNDIEWAITTNGTLLNESIVDFCDKHNIYILLSIDGCKTVQDYQRPCQNGQSSFDLLKKNIPYLLIRKPDTIFRSTLTKYSLNYLQETLDTIINLGFNSFTFIPNDFEVWDNKDFQKWEVFVDKEAIKLIQYASLQKPLSYRFNNLITAVKDIDDSNKNPSIQSPIAGCGMGIRGIGISPDGSLHPCQEENGRNTMDSIGDVCNGINPDLHKIYCQNLHEKWLEYLKKIDNLPTSANFKLFYANSYCSTRLKDGFAFCPTQTMYLRALHQAGSRLYLNYHLSLNPFAQQIFNI